MARGGLVSRRVRPVKERPAYSQDDVDAFHRSKDKLSLRLSDDDSDPGDVDSGPDEDAVFNIGDESSGSEAAVEFSDADQDEDDPRDGSDSEDAEEQDTRLAALTRQEKELRARLAAQDAEDSEGDIGLQEGEGPSNFWGRKKGAYYEADEDADEDANAEEELEAKRLQREAAERLRDEDFDIPAAEEHIGHPEGTLGLAADQGVQMEQLPRDGRQLTAEQKAAILEDVPELAALLDELKGSLTEVRTRIGPLVREVSTTHRIKLMLVREGGLATAQGLSYLEAKHLLLLHYCMHLTFYLLLKVEGRPVVDHPVIGRLVEIRAFMDKIRPLDKRLKYQVDKLLAAAQAVQGRAEAGEASEEDADAQELADDDPMQYAPRPEALLPHDQATSTTTASLQQDKALANGKAPVYRPPKIAPASMQQDGQEDPDRERGKRDRRAREDGARRAARSDVIQSLAAEVAGAPDEVKDTGGAEAEAAQARRVRERLAARAEQEEDQMTRVPLSKDERKRMKAARRADLAGGAMLDDFADDVAHLVKRAQADGGASLVNPSVSQRFGINAGGGVSARDKSGDADLPLRQPLHERRARLDSALGKRQAASDDSDEAPDVLATAKAGSRRPAPERDNDDSPAEDPFYVGAAQQAQGRKKQRAEKYTAPATRPPLAEPETEGPRKVSKAVEKNRGLTPHRRRDLKNPRVKGRKRFEQASKKRRGQVQDVRQPGGGYGGEATGIKSRVSKSVRL